MTDDAELLDLLAWAYGKLDAFGVGKTMAEGHPSTLKMDQIKLLLMQRGAHSAGGHDVAK